MTSASTPVDVILVRPETPANVGAVARVMRNTGLGRLVLVEPGDFRTLECWRSAWGAHDVLEALDEVAELASVLDRYEHLVAFSGRPSSEHPSEDVRGIAERFAALPPSARAAFVFGPETTGLSEDELRLCGARAIIPTHPDQPSLNLSHAVLVAGYERLRAERPGTGTLEAWTTRAEREAFLRTWRPALVTARALAPDDTRYFERWEAFFRRADLSSRELRLFEHLARKLGRS